MFVENPSVRSVKLLPDEKGYCTICLPHRLEVKFIIHKYLLGALSPQIRSLGQLLFRILFAFYWPSNVLLEAR